MRIGILRGEAAAPTTDGSTDGSSPTAVMGGRKKQLRFGVVQERRYAIGISCNPAVSSGVPVGLSWEVLSERTFLINEYRPRWYTSRPNWLPPVVRREMLYKAGYSEHEVEAVRDVIVATQRDRITSLPPLSLLEQAPWFLARGVRRTIRRAFRRSPSTETLHPLMTDDAPTVRLDHGEDLLVPASILRSTSAGTYDNNGSESDSPVQADKKKAFIIGSQQQSTINLVPCGA